MNSLQSYRVAPSSSSSSSCTQPGVPSLPRSCGCGSPRWLVVGTLPGAEPRWARFWGGFDRGSWVSASGRCPQGWAGLPSAVPPLRWAQQRGRAAAGTPPPRPLQGAAGSIPGRQRHPDPLPTLSRSSPSPRSPPCAGVPAPLLTSPVQTPALPSPPRPSPPPLIYLCISCLGNHQFPSVKRRRLPII